MSFFSLNLLTVDPFVKLTGWDWLSSINIASIFIRLVLACIFGGVIGIERTTKNILLD